MTDASQPQPFDGAAPSYDDDFTRTSIGQRQRRRVWEVLRRVFPTDGDFLDLGCGTGEDLVWLAQHSSGRVVGCDASSGMLEASRTKTGAAGLGDRVDLVELDLRRVRTAPNPGGALFAGAVSDFGVLNCLDDRRPVAEAVSR